VTSDLREPIAVLEGVTVRYGAVEALKDVSAVFPSGAVGLLGPNGAGKTTLVRALLGLLQPDAGRMSVLGVDAASAPLALRSRIGYMPETDAHIPGMNAVSFVSYCGELAGLPRAEALQRAHETLFYVGLGEARYRNVETYSTGMKQRIKLAQAVVHDPDLLFLDEPTNGLDPQGRAEMLELIADLANQIGVNVIVSSHLLPDVEQVCRAAVVMDRGRIVAQGAIDALRQPRGSIFELRVKTAGDPASFASRLREVGIECHDSDEGLMRVFVPAERNAHDIFAAAAASGAQVRHLRPSVPTLEDTFTRLVGEPQ
jgi:ABC-2 type transport system ATP-binding protein